MLHAILRAMLHRVSGPEQLPSPNLDSDSQESVFDRVETLYNTVVSVLWDNIIMLWLNDRHLVKVF